MISPTRTVLAAGLACAFLVGGHAALAAVSAQEAEKLKTTLTPLGGERAGNAEGTIPTWTGGYTTPIPGSEVGGRRPDPFADEKPLFSITAANMEQYADKLTDGTKEMLKKYPDTYRIDIYPTHRTAAAPQWVYDNTFKNATRAKLVDLMPEGTWGGIPFPIPQSGAEVMWNHILRVRPEAWSFAIHGYLNTATGKHVLTTDLRAELNMPYYFNEHEDGPPANSDGDFWMIRLINSGPPIRAGEGQVIRDNLNPDKVQSWVYLTGQRRVRKLPNPCCDTPAMPTAGVMSMDDLEVWMGSRLDRFDWEILGKKEMYVPYNGNRIMTPTKDSDVLGEHHLNPDWVRWELHRVWVVEATLAEGKRHQAARSIYYIDEDSWMATAGDRWDSGGQLWKTLWMFPIIAPEVPCLQNQTFGFYDLLSGTWFANGLLNETTAQLPTTPRWPERIFTPESLAGEGVR
ncbi:MAG: DUF1329 domain-containing protein [Deferrisomatales bacterium]|nr:DUF1329 domain-containing protein [Deferrisomatales bacterium]